MGAGVTINNNTTSSPPAPAKHLATAKQAGESRDPNALGGGL